MALIKCPECGKEISDKAPACIHCGYPLHEAVTSAVKTSEPEYCEVIFNRVSMWDARIVPCRVFIDGVQVVQIANGETKKVKVLAGLKTITLEGPEKNPHSIIGSGMIAHTEQFEISAETKNVFIIKPSVGMFKWHHEFLIERDN